jgi:hypothetical protein
MHAVCQPGLRLGYTPLNNDEMKSHAKGVSAESPPRSENSAAGPRYLIGHVKFRVNFTQLLGWGKVHKLSN